MDDGPDLETREFMEDIANDMGYKREDAPGRRRKESSGKKSIGKTIGYIAAGIIAVILLVLLLSGGGDKVSREELDSVISKLKSVEEKLTRIEDMVEGVNEKIAMLEKQDKTLLRSNSLRKRSIKANTALLKKLSQETEGLKKKMASTTVKPPPAQAAQAPKKVSADKRYHQVQAGESLYAIAKQYGISTEELCKINKISPKQVISPGQKLLIKPEGGT